MMLSPGFEKVPGVMLEIVTDGCDRVMKLVTSAPALLVSVAVAALLDAIEKPDPEIVTAAGDPATT